MFVWHFGSAFCELPIYIPFHLLLGNFIPAAPMYNPSTLAEIVILSDLFFSFQLF